MFKKHLILFSVMSLMFACGTSTKNAEKEGDNDIYMLVGTYTEGKSEGIYIYKLDTLTGDSKLHSTTPLNNPSFLTLSEDESIVYAVSENNTEEDAVTAYAFDKSTGKLVFLNTQLTNGTAPCHVAINPLTGSVITANYMGGSITEFKTDENGLLLPTEGVVKFSGKGKHAERQEQAHLHNIQFTPDNKFMYAVDLGTDKIYKFNLQSSSPRKTMELGTPASFDLEAGTGPRHLTFHPHYKYAYLITELSGDVVAFHYNDGNLEEFQTIQVDSVGAQGSADIQISADGKFLYASNRLKADGIAIFSISQDTGILTKVGYQDTGIHPRSFGITPNDKFVLVACKDSEKIQVFERNIETGLLKDIYKDIQIDAPVCIKFASY